ncbi:MAG: dihydroorotate dehydrogenase electron transfer subunit [Lachnospiraceae bacterium]|nr:dihydroorotate dehydrogenase electron transfer subunit [Lachnospiraceae bacterium]
MKRKENARVCGINELAPGIFSLWLESSMAAEAKPGCFVGVYPKNGAHVLMRPISICDVNAQKTQLRLVFRAAGEGTKEISGLRVGEEVALLGVLGNGYDTQAMQGKKLLLLGGGIGIPPMLLLAKELSDAGISCNAVLGYADRNDFLRDEFDNVCRTYVATMDGSLGTKGTVIDALNENMLMADICCACGPMPMLKAVKGFAADCGMKAYLSLEERMACGVGACLGCVTKTAHPDPHTHVNNTRICVEGPVFDASEVLL